MTMVGIRELKTHLSAYLKRVERGESVAISMHGKQVATIIPRPKNRTESKLWELVRKGAVSWSGGKPTGLKNLIPSRGKPASEMIIEDREDRF
jgi:prevent-host-death family protein